MNDDEFDAARGILTGAVLSLGLVFGPGAGRHDEPAPSCSFFCEMAEQEYSA